MIPRFKSKEGLAYIIAYLYYYCWYEWWMAARLNLTKQHFSITGFINCILWSRYTALWCLLAWLKAGNWWAPVAVLLGCRLYHNWYRR